MDASLQLTRRLAYASSSLVAVFAAAAFFRSSVPAQSQRAPNTFATSTEKVRPLPALPLVVDEHNMWQALFAVGE